LQKKIIHRKEENIWKFKITNCTKKFSTKKPEKNKIIIINL